MRKLCVAGAVIASGMFLFASSPAQADDPSTPSGLLPGSSAPSTELPGDNAVGAPFGDLLAGAGGYALNQLAAARTNATSGVAPTLSGANVAAQQARDGLSDVRRPTNNLHLSVPVDGHTPIAHLAPNLAPDRQSTEGLPAADVIGPLEPGTALNGGAGLLGGNLLPLLTGVMPDGQQQSFDDLDRPTVGQTESISTLLGALPSVPGGGNGVTSDVAGLPGGGMAVLAPAVAPAQAATSGAATLGAATPGAATPGAAATPTASGAATPAPADPATTAATTPADPGSATPSTTAPSHKVKPSASGPADPRLHEEPVDGEAGRRTFSSDGRPVAGVDPQYN